MNRFFSFALLLCCFFPFATRIHAQIPEPDKPSVLPPETNAQEAAAAPEPQTNVPPESAKTALSADAPDSLELKPEQENLLRQITDILYEVPPNRSGGGDTDIVEIPLSLQEALNQVQGGNERLAAVEAYWHLRSTIAALNVEIHIRESAENAFQVLSQAQNDTPDYQALMAACRVSLSSADARIAQLRVEIREGQIDLMRKTRRSIELGWPIPSSVPWYGNYSLQSETAQSRSFELASEAILIPEKIRACYTSGFALGAPESLFTPEVSAFERIDDGYLYLKTLDNKRLAALGYIRVLESLNDSIARYVSAYSSTIDTRTFVNCLIGTAEE